MYASKDQQAEDSQLSQELQLSEVPVVDANYLSCLPLYSLLPICLSRPGPPLSLLQLNSTVQLCSNVWLLTDLLLVYYLIPTDSDVSTSVPAHLEKPFILETP